MTPKDLHYMWERPAFGLVRGLYVKKGKLYKRNYEPDGQRRVLFPREVREDLGIEGSSSDLSYLLNKVLTRIAPKNKVDFVSLKDMDEVLGRENETDLKEFFRARGREFLENISHITPDDFKKAYPFSMILYDIVLGARYDDIEKPRPGFAHYQYELEMYPFEAGSPSENGIWAFAQGAASKLHSDPEKKRNMRALIFHGGDKVRILSEEESAFKPEVLKLAL
ncbi:MAG: hypothetical protein JSV39_00935 [Candidatus Aenigmatarchaeota archaeon]|nr:MAG: hypothetical protein JSV39_00935 [Candidatus Aenigmarchaeota archaeon]